MSASPSKSDIVTPEVVAPSSEEQFHSFWQKNSTAIYTFCIIIAVGIIGKGVWNYMTTEKEKSTQSEYAAATTVDSLKAFVSAHDSHPLAGAANLQLADRAYAAEHYAEAATDYEVAAKTLPVGVFVFRARLGLAMSEVQSARTSEGEAGLKALSADLTAPSAIRAEATYQLASIAAAAGRTDEAVKLADSVAQMDQVGWWAQRAYGLRASLGSKASTPGTIQLGSK